MAEETTKVRSGGLGLGTILFLIFLVLKLTGHVTWSWVWVTSPLWISFAVFMVFLLIVLIVGAIAAASSTR